MQHSGPAVVVGTQEEVAKFDHREIERWLTRLHRMHGSDGAASIDDESIHGGPFSSMYKDRKLLYDVFPKHIADQLKDGKKVSNFGDNTFDCVA